VVVELSLWLMLAGVVGAKLPLVVTAISRQQSVGPVLLHSAGASLWGLAAAVLAALAITRRHRLSFDALADVCAPSIALGIAVGKVGCLLAGCCYGRPTSVAWAIAFPPSAEGGLTAPVGLPLHPCQLYEAGGAILVLAVLALWERKGHTWPGQIFWLFTLLYSCLRVPLEEFRATAVTAGLSDGQAIALFFGVLGGVMLRWHRKVRDEGISSVESNLGLGSAGTSLE
jgi:phosphatidylglycerol:prolipoprotein diacylglycerol transferase